MLPAGNDTRNIAREFAIRAIPTQSSIIAKYTGLRLKRKTPVSTRVVVGFLTSKAVRALVSSCAAAVTSSTAAMINIVPNGATAPCGTTAAGRRESIKKPRPIAATGINGGSTATFALSFIPDCHCIVVASMKYRMISALTLAVLGMFMVVPAKAETSNDIVQIWSERLLSEASRRADLAEQALKEAATRVASPPSVDVVFESAGPATQTATLPDLIQRILKDAGLPETLIALAQVESGLNPLALSPKGARGIWQLMPDTARTFGLIVDSRRDDRIDPVKSTIAAARYLRLLHSEWGDWNLAFAAYNAGSGAVERASAGNRTWSTSLQRRLPAETRAYVPKVWREIYQYSPSGLSGQEKQP